MRELEGFGQDLGMTKPTSTRDRTRRLTDDPLFDEPTGTTTTSMGGGFGYPFAYETIQPTEFLTDFGGLAEPPNTRPTLDLEGGRDSSPKRKRKRSEDSRILERTLINPFEGAPVGSSESLKGLKKDLGF
ncbi:hypothetical protein ACFQH6_03755 [Halobacteriaceae archaeon GCM10025711]